MVKEKMENRRVEVAFMKEQSVLTDQARAEGGLTVLGLVGPWAQPNLGCAP
jgi:hypothetical protein